jgi:hypothetical protein
MNFGETALTSSLCLLAILLLTLVGCVSVQAVLWVQASIAVLVALAFGLFLFTYCYLAINDPDSLR